MSKVKRRKATGPVTHASDLDMASVYATLDFARRDYDGAIRERDEARRQRDALVDGIRAVLGNDEGRISTHYEGCEETHWRCVLGRLLREVER